MGGSSWARSSTRRRGCCPGENGLAEPGLDEPGEEVGLGLRGLDARLAQDVCLLPPRLTPAVEAELHERVVVRDLGHVLVDRVPLALKGLAADVDPRRDLFIRDEHLRLERLELRDLLRRGVLRG